MSKRITKLIGELKEKYPDGRHWRAEFIHHATQRRLSQDVSQKLSDMIGYYMDYSSDRQNYIGFYEDLFDSIGASDTRDFITKYAMQSGITESENEAHRFVDTLFAAEEVIQGNFNLDEVLSHYEIEQEEPQRVETGLDRHADVEVITLEGDGYSETQKGELNDFIQIQQPPDGRRG